MAVAWETPPPLRENAVPFRPDTKGRPTKYVTEALELAKRPGEWARLRTFSHRVREHNAYDFAQRVKTGKLLAFAPAGAYEAVARVMPDRSVAVFARYVGEG